MIIRTRFRLLHNFVVENLLIVSLVFPTGKNTLQSYLRICPKRRKIPYSDPVGESAQTTIYSVCMFCEAPYLPKKCG